MRGLARRIVVPTRAVADTFRNPGLRRLQLAWVGSILGSWSYLVALVVYAYAHGGAGAVALVAVLRMVPAALFAPFTATVADRFPRHLVLIAADLLRATLMCAAAAVVGGGGPAWVVYAVVGLSTVVGTPFRPAQASLLPSLARTPGELTAANVAASTLEAVGTFAGPAIGGFVLAATNIETVFGLNAASFVWSAVLVLGIKSAPLIEERSAVPRKGGLLGDDAAAGFRTILRNHDVRLLVGLYTGQTLIAGTLSVTVAVTALEILRRGSSTVGLLYAAIGIGGLVGGAVALALAPRGRLATDFGLGLALFGAPFALIGAVPHYVAALLALGVLGVGNSLVDISAITLLQRIVPDEVLGRVLGVLEGLMLASIGLGAVVAPVLIHVVHPRAALVIVGAVLPVLAVVGWPRLHSIDATTKPLPVFGLLQGVEIFASLSPAVLQRLVSALVEVRVPAGTTVIRKGEAGDRFYVVEDGEVEIEGNVFGPGSSFGEIALLRDVPRTATVTARTDVLLHALERDVFLAAVTQHESSSAAADAVIARRLGDLRAELTTEGGAA